MKIGGFEPIRDGTNHLIGWKKKDPRSGVTHVYDKGSHTIGWAKEDDSSGPGYTVQSKGNERITQGCNPEYLLGKYTAENKRKEEKKESKPTNWLFKGQGSDGSDPKYR